MSTPNLLLHFDSNFSDATGRHVPTTVAATISSAQSKFGGASALFTSTGGGSYVNVADNMADFTFAGDFTIDMWFQPTSFSNGVNLFNPGNDGLHIYNTTAQPLYIYSSYATGNPAISGTTTLVVGTWYHVAVTRSGSSVRLFLNGVQEGATWTYAGTFTPTAPIYIGENYNAGQITNGYIDEFRLVNGTADWTTTFTPPTAPYTLAATVQIAPQTFSGASTLGVGQTWQTLAASAGLAVTSTLLPNLPIPVVGIVKSVGPQWLSGGAGLAVAVRNVVGVHQTLAATSGLLGNYARVYPSQFGNALFAGASSLLVVDNSTWPNVIHTAHANDPEEEDIRTNVNDGQCLVVDGPSLVGRVTTGFGPAQRILFGGTLHVTGYTLADDQSVLNANVATLQSQVATLQGTESADASNIAALQAQNATQATENNSLQAQINALQAQVTSLNQQVTILSATSHVGPLQAMLGVTSNMLARSSALVQATPAGFAVGSNLQGDIGRDLFAVAGFAAQFALSASALQVMGVGPLRFTSSFYMTAFATGPAFALPATMQVASGLMVGFTLYAQPAVMTQTFGLTAAAGNLLTMLPGLMVATSNLTADATAGGKILAPQTINATAALTLSPPILLGAIQVSLPGTSTLAAIAAAPLPAAALLVGTGALAVAETQLLQVATVPMFAAGTAFGAAASTLKWGNALFAGAGSLRGDAAPSYSTLNPAQVQTGLTLSSGNRTATATASQPYASILGTRSHNSGKYYFEVKINTPGQTPSGLWTGADACVQGSAYGDNWPVGNNGYGVVETAGLNSPYALIALGTTSTTYGNQTTNDVISIAVDATAGSIYVAINNHWITAGGAFNAGSPDFSPGTGRTYWPQVGVDYYSGIGSSVTFNPGNVAFAYTPPSGFSAWG